MTSDLGKEQEKEYDSSDDEDDSLLFVTIKARDGWKERELLWQLDEAMYSKIPYVIVDHPRLSEQTSIAIRTGNFLHKFAVLSGVFSVASGIFGFNIISVPLCLSSAISALFYKLSWSNDPCCQYQVVPPERFAIDAPIFDSSNVEPGQVILVRRNDIVRKKLHNTIATFACLFCAYKIRSFRGGIFSL